MIQVFYRAKKIYAIGTWPGKGRWKSKGKNHESRSPFDALTFLRNGSRVPIIEHANTGVISEELRSFPGSGL